MNKEQQVPLREIAEQAGVTRMAVSLALRGKPGVSEKTRKHILAIAQKLGYAPDPEVAKLLSRIRSRVPPESRSCLALLTSGSTAHEWKKYITERKYVEGAHERAKQYGYRIEEFWVNEPGMTSSRLSNILWNRGIEGVIIAPIQGRLSKSNGRSIDLDFSLFSMVEISETVHWPDLDRALHDQYTAMMKCLEELHKLGYQRVGLVLEEALDLRVNGRWTAAFLRYLHLENGREYPPPLIMAMPEQAAFRRWYNRYQPDVIISVDHFGSGLIKQAGLKIPDDIGYVSLDVEGDAQKHPELTGIDQHSNLVGAAAVDVLVGTIHRGQHGIPDHPVRIEVEGDWVIGKTTRTAAG